MNAPEKNILKLALCLFVVGIMVRILPWGLPSIESFQVGENIIVSAENAYNAAPDTIKVSNFDNKVSDASHKNVRKVAKKPKLPVHVNSATADELCALKGVGPKLAEKIVATREAIGPFKTGADLQKVPGIGKKKLEGLLPGVIFD